MTYPGLEGQKALGRLTTTAFPIRQSRAGGYPGGETYTTVLDSMGGHAPASGITAEQVTVAQEVAADPHPIEKDNFELADSLGGIDQFGVDQTSPSFFSDDADPGYTGQ